jgi:hypothetical protein
MGGRAPGGFVGRVTAKPGQDGQSGDRVNLTACYPSDRKASAGAAAALIAAFTSAKPHRQFTLLPAP